MSVNGERTSAIVLTLRPYGGGSPDELLSLLFSDVRFRLQPREQLLDLSAQSLIFSGNQLSLLYTRCSES